MTEADVRRHIAYKVSVRELKPDAAERMIELLDAGAEPDYGALYRAATLLPPPPVVYHTSPRAVRASIMEHGLLAALPSDGRWGRGAVGQPRGVYVGGAYDRYGIWSPTSKWDAWVVTLGDLPWEHDLLNPGSWVITGDVPPSALRLYNDCNNCGGSGIVGSPPDQYMDCPECMSESGHHIDDIKDDRVGLLD